MLNKFPFNAMSKTRLIAAIVTVLLSSINCAYSLTQEASAKPLNDDERAQKILSEINAFEKNSQKETPQADPWESESVHNFDRTNCAPSLTSSIIVIPVPLQMRSHAIESLISRPMVRLDEQTAAQFLKTDALNEGDNLAMQIRRYEIAEMKAKKRLQQEKQIGGWSVYEEKSLEEKERSLSDMAFLKPYLIRAVAKHEQTGSFSALVCGDVLEITHGSLGRFIPQSTRLPVIVFLPDDPQAVSIRWSIDE